MFFVGNDGYLLKYYLGTKKIPECLIKDFWQNLGNRARFCATRQILFRHIIIPDKQTVYPERFPFLSYSPLATAFLKQNEEFGSKLLFPVKTLSDDHAEARTYPIQDSHLSGLGQLLCARLLVDSLGPPLERGVYEALNQSLVTRSMSGNLAEITLRSDKTNSTVFSKWPYIRVYDNRMSGGTRGYVRVFCNPYPIRDQCLLLIGSSSLMILAPILACIYRKVIFGRSPNVHFSLVDQVCPDVLVTGHIERYLLQIKQDNQKEAPDIDPFGKLYRCAWDSAFHEISEGTSTIACRIARHEVDP